MPIIDTATKLKTNRKGTTMIGTGVYRLAEVARFTEIPLSTVRAWFLWRSDRAGRGPLFKPDYRPVRGDVTLSFLNLIDAHVAGFFRAAGVKPALIRRAYQVLGEELSSVHPFAHADLCTDGSRILRATADAVGDRHLIDVVSRQRWFAQMQDHLRKIDYERQSRLATRWRIADGVALDPRVRFGKPVAGKTGVTTYILAAQYRANDQNAALVADLFSVTEQDVLRAVGFEQKFGTRHAA